MATDGCERNEALARACAEAGLPPSFERLVDSLLDSTDDAWRTCCGKDCQPCSLTLAAAVDRARGLMRPG